MGFLNAKATHRDQDRRPRHACCTHRHRAHAGQHRAHAGAHERARRRLPASRQDDQVPAGRAGAARGRRQGITVSTLKEAEQFFAAGIADILYAVGIVPAKLRQALALRRRGCDLKIITDSVAGARRSRGFGKEHGEALEVWIEIDVDGHRSGIPPESEVAGRGRAARCTRAACALGGVMAHAGASYDCDTPRRLRKMAEQERAGTRARRRAPAAGGPAVPVVSVGSTPTALSAQHLGRRDRGARRRLRVLRPRDAQHRRMRDRGHRAVGAHDGHRPSAGEGLGHRRCGLDGDEPRPRHRRSRSATSATARSARRRRAHRGLRRSTAPTRSTASSAAPEGVDAGDRRAVSRRHATAHPARTTPAPPARRSPSTRRSLPSGEVEAWPRFYGW